MDQQILTQLNQLNRGFYNSVGHEFDETRQQPWEGWQKIIEKGWLPDRNDVSVLDVGCGNGRLGVFLHQRLNHTFSYYGLDQNQQLLAKAEDTLSQYSNNFHLSLLDIVENMSQLDTVFGSQRFDAITVFGVLHHIPSGRSRSQFLKQLGNMLKPTGVLILTTWNFDQQPNLLKRAVAPEVLNLHKDDLEENDYLLDWQRGTAAIRYCHLTTAREFQNLCQANGFTINGTFDADGRNHTSNTYYLCRKTIVKRGE